MTRPVIFLDFDGVVATTRARMATRDIVDPVAMGILRLIVADTDASIVVTSTWRSSADRCRDAFDRHGLSDALWTPISSNPDDPDDWRVDPDNGSRAATIDRWLASHPSVSNWIIVDDERCDYDRAKLNRLVHVDMAFGLGHRDHSRAVRLLNGVDHGGDAPYQTPRITIANQAAAAAAALDQGDVQTALDLLAIIAQHPLAQ